MADSARARRLAKRIVAIVATELELKVKDPRLAMTTVTAATVTPDLREAVVFYTVYGDEEEVASTAVALASATGVLRSAVGRETGIKFTPTLAFRLDTIPENAHRIDDLIAAAKATDAAVASQAAGAQYAGDADPYKVPREPEDDADLEDDSDLDDAADLDNAEDPSRSSEIDGSPAFDDEDVPVAGSGRTRP
ncbi:ribosome-binding factor A [Nakamurella sp. UYEF19]|uniref:30S ribosome-binding factor RbfA n=1 Tax=Nakamurella sp. UYEF19 TaxID=1756392 RepID=UPI0033975A57